MRTSSTTNYAVTSPYVESYRKQLDELNAVDTPAILFNDIDSMLKTYQSLKRQYSLEWRNWEMYESKIKTFLRSKNPHKRSIAVSIKEIQIFIEKIRKIQQSLKEWLKDFVTTNVNNDDYNSQYTKTSKTNINIRPSQVRNSSFKSSKSSKNKHKRKKSKQDSMSVQDEPPIFFRRVRSFGTIFSKQFQVETVKNYKQSMFLLNNINESTDSGDVKSVEIDEHDIKSQAVPTSKQMKVVRYFHDNCYGQNEVFESAFGVRPVIYCDWTASGKPLECVERYLSEEMYTLYANTHTTTSITGIQTSKFRSEARSIILQSVGGDLDSDVIIFTGSGVTGAIYKMSRILMQSIGKSYKPETTVVFISIYEHNSNIFIWKELGCKIIVIPEDVEKGALDLKYLEKKLKSYTSVHIKNKYNLLIGSFTAASNVSGIIAPIDECTLLLHQYGALSFWDYATAAPYLDVAMTNEENDLLSKDAVFISTHKYLAGPGSPGILCAKKRLCTNYVPVVPGGGTVFAAFGIEDGEWQYLDNIEEREEGGTPDIIGSVRAAFAFMIKDHLSTQFIEETERKYLDYFLEQTKELRENNLVLMGNSECERLPVLSFLIKYCKKEGFGSTKTKYLHYNFIAALFNDLFGIQGRGGCACAGMYGLAALNMNDEEVDHVLHQMRGDKNELARPGYFRINLHYTLTENELKYVVNATKYICNNGWRFLPFYDVDKETGNYVHKDIRRKPDLLKKQLRSLLDISFSKENGSMQWIEKHMRVDGKQLNENLDKFFVLADDILNNFKQYVPSKDEFISEAQINDDNAWYWLPSELYNDAMHYVNK